VKVALDTNVIFAAFATRGLCADLLQVVLAEHQLVLGETVLSEVDRTLTKKLRMPAERADAIGAFLREQAVEVVGDAPPSPIPVRDTADEHVLAEAIAGNAEVLITGDRDLLAVAARAPLAIVAPRAFWELLTLRPRND
jgi:putative PIN family toxin of toxin-antitoxin system